MISETLALRISMHVPMVLIGSFRSIPGRHRCSMGAMCLAPAGYNVRESRGCDVVASAEMTAPVRCVVSNDSSEL